MIELDEVLRIAGRLEAMADEGKVRISPMEARALALDLRTIARDCEPRRTCWDVGDGLTFRCSKCGCEFDMFDRDGEPTTWIGDVPRLPNYCPNCGAKCGAEVI